MKIIIDIPEEYERDFIGDKFGDFFSRVIADIDYNRLCGKHGKEIAEMFLEAFDKTTIGEINPNAKVIPVANISFDKDDMREIIREELEKFKRENKSVQKQRRVLLFENENIDLKQRGNKYYLSLYDKEGKFQREVTIDVKDDYKVGLGNCK